MARLRGFLAVSDLYAVLLTAEFNGFLKTGGSMSLQGHHIEPLIPDLKRYARSLSHNEDDACDLVQDCVERALVKQGLYKDGTNLRSWMFTLMRNVFISQKRRDAVARRYVQHAMHYSSGISQASQTHRVYLNQTLEAIDNLSATERAAVKMLGIEERSHQEAAARADLPVGTMKSRLSRGRSSLRVTLGEAA